MVFGSHSHLWLSPPRYFLSRSFASALSGYGAFAICSCIDLCYYFIIFWQRNVTKGKMFIWFFIETWISQDPNPSQIYKFMQKVEMTSKPLENLFWKFSSKIHFTVWCSLSIIKNYKYSWLFFFHSLETIIGTQSA